MPILLALYILYSVCLRSCLHIAPPEAESSSPQDE